MSSPAPSGPIPIPASAYPAGLTLLDARLVGAFPSGTAQFAFVLLKLRDANNRISAQVVVASGVNTVWQNTWLSLGAPPPGFSVDNTFQGTAVFINQNQFVVYVCGVDGQVWARLWNGGAWLAWTACKPINNQPAPISSVDHVSGQYLFVADAAGQAWAMTFTNNVWVSAKQPNNSGLLRLTTRSAALTMGGNYYSAISVSAQGLIPRLFAKAGINSSRYVVVSEGTTASGIRWMTHPSIRVVGWNPSAPSELIVTMSRGSVNGRYQFDLKKDFMNTANAPRQLEPGALCWLESEGGQATSDFGTANVREDASAANFNYRPDLIGSAQDAAIGYKVSCGGTPTSPYASFSGCSNTSNPASSLAP
jgi:hypothetical protein